MQNVGGYITLLEAGTKVKIGNFVQNYSFEKINFITQNLIQIVNIFVFNCKFCSLTSINIQWLLNRGLILRSQFILPLIDTMLVKVDVKREFYNVFFK